MCQGSVLSQRHPAGTGAEAGVGCAVRAFLEARGCGAGRPARGRRWAQRRDRPGTDGLATSAAPGKGDFLPVCLSPPPSSPLSGLFFFLPFSALPLSPPTSPPSLPRPSPFSPLYSVGRSGRGYSRDGTRGALSGHKPASGRVTEGSFCASAKAPRRSDLPPGTSRSVGSLGGGRRSWLRGRVTRRPVRALGRARPRPLLDCRSPPRPRERTGFPSATPPERTQ